MANLKNKKPVPVYTEYTDQELLEMTRQEASQGLTERQIAFCNYFVEGHNRKMAMIKAGFESQYANGSYSARLLRNVRIQRYVNWLKVRALNEHMVSAIDVLDEWIRIAFADMTDFVDIYSYGIKLKPSDQVDGQLIKSIKSGRDGVSIELHDKMKALDNLAKYMDNMPMDWKRKLEERKQELLEQEFELKKRMSEYSIPTVEDDGLIEALKKSSETIWDENDDD